MATLSRADRDSNTHCRLDTSHSSTFRTEVGHRSSLRRILLSWCNRLTLHLVTLLAGSMNDSLPSSATSNVTLKARDKREG